ncbi:hypothetical protein BV25DRAFT_1822955 [Artomyces pyxidatus]|uniref:Uncharacterized protein n=1 Tax=Artomyces pyxidatus TaxID=48021 RepID=A0ACB8T7Z0_9AGAM|nr:hypothetical protein BV25DRAFT_1822955 [Artomyces pyxidatus]
MFPSQSLGILVAHLAMHIFILHYCTLRHLATLLVSLSLVRRSSPCPRAVNRDRLITGLASGHEWRPVEAPLLKLCSAGREYSHPTPTAHLQLLHAAIPQPCAI